MEGHTANVYNNAFKTNILYESCPSAAKYGHELEEILPLTHKYTYTSKLWRTDILYM